ncbi:NAD(P)/FAD-dependent oxidoreductase [Rhodococcus koreensis]
MTERNRIVVVGGSLAGVNVLDGLRSAGYQGELVLISGEVDLPYDRPPLSKGALAGEVDPDSLLLKPREWYADQAIETSLGDPAVGLDTQEKVVVLESGRRVAYGKLAIATGCRPRRLGPDAHPGILALRTLDDCRAVRDALVPAGRLVVVGAGFIGLEVAAVATGLGMNVTVVEASTTPLTRVIGEDAGTWFQDFHVARGVDLRCGTTVRLVTSAGPRDFTVELSDGSTVAADLVVAGVGVTPTTDWLDGSPIETSNGVVCTNWLETSVPGIVAAGDIARWRHPIFGQDLRVEQWLNATEQGVHAAHTLLGQREAFAALPYFWSDQFDAKVRFVGHTEGADRIEVLAASDTSMVAVFGRAGVLRGVLAVNAPRQLAMLRNGVKNAVAFNDVLTAV